MVWMNELYFSEIFVASVSHMRKQMQLLVLAFASFSVAPGGLPWIRLVLLGVSGFGKFGAVESIGSKEFIGIILF